MYKRIIIITLLMIIFLCNIGFAKFKNEIKIYGTANDGNRFYLEFENAEIENCIGANRNNSFIRIIDDKKSLYVNAADLSYPGAKVVFSATVINKGSIPAKLQDLNIDGLNESSVIKVKLLSNSKEIINPNEKTKILFTVLWDENCQKNNVNEKANFKINLNYIQAY